MEYSFCRLLFKFVPRLGMLVEMPHSFENITYFGYDDETLSDFREHSIIRRVATQVSDMHVKYIKPQESGMRYNTFYAEITDNDGTGMRFESKNLLFSMQTIIMQSKVQRQRIKKIFLITIQQMFRWTVICSAPAPMPAALCLPRVIRSSL